MKRFISIIVLFVIIISGCELASSPKADEQTGSIYINLGYEDIENRTIVPDVVMEIASYDITLNGPNSALIQVPGVTDAFYFQSGLAIGAWTVTVDAKNADGVIIARDSQGFSILIDNTTPVSIVVVPLTGDGTLNVNISWPVNIITTPVVSAQLVSSVGVSSDLTFTVGATSATYASSTIAAGYYELIISVLDDTNPVWGIGEVVRIVEGEITSATWPILSDSAGSVGITITSDLQNPITLSLSGAIDSLNLGEDMTVAVSPSSFDSYKWYVNGQVQTGETATSITVGSSLLAGSYTLTSIIGSGSVLSSESVPFSVNAWAESQLLASDGAGTDYFGYSTAVSSDGNTIIVSAANDDDNGADSGSVYVYKWSGSAWNETKVTAISGGDAGDSFGQSVSVSSDGSSFVVGNVTGSLYLYELNGTAWDETIVSKTAATSFGLSVSISSDGNTIVSGAPGDTGIGPSTGALYILKWDGSDWVETKTSATDGALFDGFGVSVSVSSDGNTVLAGSVQSEAIYIYKWNGTTSTWDETILTASDGATGDFFGSSVSLSDDGNTLVSGANGADAAYVFKWDGADWNETKLTPSDGTGGDNFGFSVAISPDGNTVVAGADQQNTATGAVYVYEWIGDSWKEIKMTAADGAADDNFGNSVSVSNLGSKIVTGAYLNDTSGGTDSGSLYVFEK